MTKVIFSSVRSSAAKWSRRQWLLFACTMCAGGIWLAATRGAEQNDSGWAIAAPSPIAKGEKSHDFRQQIVLRHVLEQTQQPLLKQPSPNSTTPTANSTAAPSAAERGQSGLRLSIRPDGSDGWRPAGQANNPTDRTGCECE